jgi:DNA-binding winged helix-turn-helix (wHTH) protein
VDVHVRRLRAKLGAEYEALIGTVRNVGYRFVPAKGSDEARAHRPARVGGRPASEADPVPLNDHEPDSGWQRKARAAAADR